MLVLVDVLDLGEVADSAKLRSNPPDGKEQRNSCDGSPAVNTSTPALESRTKGRRDSSAPFVPTETQP